MASLLSLPEELIDDIIERVILYEQPAPQDAEEGEIGRRKPIWNSPPFDLNCQGSRYGAQLVRFRTDWPSVNATPLFLINSYFHRQTQAAIARLYPEGIRYRLDCIILDETYLLPTWTHIPVFSRQITAINVTFRRLASCEGSERGFLVRSYRGPPSIIWAFNYLLEVFLKCGPIATSVHSTIPRYNHGVKLGVNHINLHFVTSDKIHDDSDDRNRGRFVNLPDRRRRLLADAERTLTDQEVSETALTSAMLAQFIAGYLEGLLSMSYHMAAFGAIIHEKVGDFTISADDEIIHQTKISNALACMFVQPDVGSNWCTSRTFGHLHRLCRLLTFWHWKYFALKQRDIHHFASPDVTTSWPSQSEYSDWKKGCEEAREDARSYDQNNGCSSDNCRCEEVNILQVLPNG